MSPSDRRGTFCPSALWGRTLEANRKAPLRGQIHLSWRSDSPQITRRTNEVEDRLDLNPKETDLVPVPDPAAATIVQDPLGKGPGHWAGGPSAALGPDGAIYLAYRFRRPFGEGRGFLNVVARSEDGERFQTLAELDRKEFHCESLER